MYDAPLSDLIEPGLETPGPVRAMQFEEWCLVTVKELGEFSPA